MSFDTDRCFGELNNGKKYLMGSTRSSDNMRIYSESECSTINGTLNERNECLNAFNLGINASEQCKVTNVTPSGCIVDNKLLGRPGINEYSTQRIYSKLECDSMEGTFLSSSGQCLNANNGNGGKQFASEVCGKLNFINVSTTCSNVPPGAGNNLYVKIGPP